MPLSILSSGGKIVELQLAIRSQVETKRRPLNRSRAPAASFREMWQGGVAFAAANFADVRKLAAWLDAHDGRVTPFGLLLKQGFATHANDFTGTLAAGAASGADTIRVTRTSPTILVRAGTLLTVGVAGELSSQVVEVLDDVEVTHDTTIRIAPRIRAARVAGAAVVGGDAILPVRVSGDDTVIAGTATHGVITIDVIEAVD